MASVSVDSHFVVDGSDLRAWLGRPGFFEPADRRAACLRSKGCAAGTYPLRYGST